MKTTLSLLAVIIAALPIFAADTVLLPQAIADANEGGQADVDLSAYKGTAGFILTAKSTAGTTPAAAIKLQSSPPLAKGNAVETGTTAGVALRTATNTAIKLGASFTTAAGSVPSAKTIVLPLKKHATLASGTITLNLCVDSSGPSTSLGSATFNVADLTDAFTGASFTFTTPVQLAAETKYWITIESDYTVDATANLTWRTTTVASGGNASVFGTGWVASATNNLNFAVFQYVFSDVTNGAFTSVGTTGSIQEITLPIQNFGSVFRAHATITGTNTPSFIVGVAAIQK